MDLSPVLRVLGWLIVHVLVVACDLAACVPWYLGVRPDDRDEAVAAWLWTILFVFLASLVLVFGALWMAGW